MLDGSFLTAITADSWRAILVWILLTGFTWAAFWYRPCDSLWRPALSPH
jgi:hypothetical protein